MTDDLVKRLRSITDSNVLCKDCYKSFEAADEAADRIETLEAAQARSARMELEAIKVWRSLAEKHKAENERLLKVLLNISQLPTTKQEKTAEWLLEASINIARAALAGEKKDG